MKRRRFLETLTAALLAVTMITGGFAPAAPPEGKGNNNDGGTEEPVLPPIEYQLHYFTGPLGVVTVLGDGFNDMNYGGICVGHYETPEEKWYGWLYDPNSGTGRATDLNSMGWGMPAGYENWVITSALHINDFGAIVGYITPEGVPGSPRRGFLVNMLADAPVVELLPDDNLSWTDTYPRRINENGDILGAFQEADGSWKAYLFNPGIYDPNSADSEPEIVHVNINHPRYTDLNNPTADHRAQIVGVTPGAYAFTYTRGDRGEPVFLAYDEPVVERCFINDASTIGGTMDVEVAAKGNKTTTERLMFRDTGSLEIFYDSSDKCGLGVWGINSYGTIITRASSGEWQSFLHNDDWGFVNPDDLVTGADPADRARTFYKINDNGPLGFGQVAGVVRYEDPPRAWYGFLIATPVETQTP